MNLWEKRLQFQLSSNPEQRNKVQSPKVRFGPRGVEAGWRVCQNVDVGHMIKTQITVNNVRRAVTDRWAPRTGGVSQRPLGINSAGLNTARVHALPLICHRGPPNGHGVSRMSH